MPALSGGLINYLRYVGTLNKYWQDEYGEERENLRSWAPGESLPLTPTLTAQCQAVSVARMQDRHHDSKAFQAFQGSCGSPTGGILCKYSVLAPLIGLHEPFRVLIQARHCTARTVATRAPPIRGPHDTRKLQNWLFYLSFISRRCKAISVKSCRRRLLFWHFCLAFFFFFALCFFNCHFL